MEHPVDTPRSVRSHQHVDHDQYFARSAQGHGASTRLPPAFSPPCGAYKAPETREQACYRLLFSSLLTWSTEPDSIITVLHRQRLSYVHAVRVVQSVWRGSCRQAASSLQLLRLLQRPDDRNASSHAPWAWDPHPLGFLCIRSPGSTGLPGWSLGDGDFHPHWCRDRTLEPLWGQEGSGYPKPSLRRTYLDACSKHQHVCSHILTVRGEVRKSLFSGVHPGGKAAWTAFTPKALPWPRALSTARWRPPGFAGKALW